MQNLPNHETALSVGSVVGGVSLASNILAAIGQASNGLTAVGAIAAPIQLLSSVALGYHACVDSKKAEENKEHVGRESSDLVSQSACIPSAQDVVEDLELL